LVLDGRDRLRHLRRVDAGRQLGDHVAVLDDGDDLLHGVVGVDGRRIDDLHMGLDRPHLRDRRVCGGIRGLVVGDAVVGRQPREPGVPALADGAELPLVVAQVQLAQHDRGLGARVAHVEARVRSAARIEDLDGQLAEVAEPGAVRVEARGDDDGTDLVGQCFEVDGDPVLGALLGGPLAQQPDRPVDAARSVVEDEVLVVADLPVLAEQQCCDVDVGHAAGIGPSHHGMEPALFDC